MLRAAALSLLVGLLAGALLMDVGTLQRSTSAPVRPAATAAPPVTVVVAPGDTAWGVAAEHAPPGTGVAEYAAAILAANDIDGRALQPGAVLLLP